MSNGHAQLGPVPRAKVSPPRVFALRRERLCRALERLWEHRAGLLVAPAGAGKTTLLADFADAAGVPVGWYRAEAGDASPPMLLHALARSLGSLLGREPSPEPACVEELVAALEAWPGQRALLVVDDLHTLIDTPAEAVLEQLLEYAPPSVHLLLASRCAPGFNVSRLRVSGKLLELGADELRFRSWEVEQLFRDFYREPLPPEDLAELARRTEGWAAGLQLFHLATRGRSTGERRRVVAALGSRSRMVREYLVRNVLDQLAVDLRDFLLGTCVLGRLTGPLCDELLERSGSGEILQALERQQIFTMALSDEGAYRYHEVLRSHLELALVEQVGEAAARRCYQRAGRLLRRAGALPEAIRAYCRSEDWDLAASLLGHDGGRLGYDNGSWLEALPPGQRDHDPWLLLARARREVALGRLAEAVATYERAARVFGSTSAADVCHRERQAVALWLEPNSVPWAGWMNLLRTATQRDPLAVAREAAALPGATGRFTEGAATLLAGHLEEACNLLTAAGELPDAPPVLAVVARVLATAAAVVTGRPGGESLPDLADAVEALGVPWLTRLCRDVATLLVARGGDGTPDIGVSERHDGDPWGAAVISFVDGILRLWDGRPAVDVLEKSALGFRRLGAGVAEAWARSGLAVAMAREGHPEARQVALTADRWARTAGVPSAEALALLALGLSEGNGGGEYLELARTAAEQCGMRLPLRLPPAGERKPVSGSPTTSGHIGNGAETPVASAAPVTLRCFGGFVLHLDGRIVDCRRLKPRPRSALHLLALHAGRPVHRETLLDALWPEVDAETGTRNLHVAISTIRRFLEPEASRGASSLVAREADAYRLALPEHAAVDLWVFEEGLTAGRLARAAQEPDAAIDALDRVLDAYTGELLPEAGPAEWVVMARERYRMQASEAAVELTELHLQHGDARRAIAVGEQGLRIDRYRDCQWRVLITACEVAGDRAAAARVRRSYQGMLAELGLASDSVCPA